MRARRRHVIRTAVIAAAVALSVLAAPAVQAGPPCPAGTAWDNRLQRCV
jgi:hypothetical protein